MASFALSSCLTWDFSLVTLSSARLIRNFTQLQNYIAPVTWGSILFFGVFHNPARYTQKVPLHEGQSPPMFSDVFVVWSLILFAIGYLSAFLWFFVRTGILAKDYKRDFSYEELYESTESFIHVEGGKRKVARFEV
jgi:hypothetical protein